VAVRADDLALVDLRDDPLPAVRDQLGGDVEQLVFEVIELQDDRITLSAIDARVALEELE
jgi:hypothetical protein